MSMTVFCEQCGEAISPSVSVCAHCGATQTVQPTPELDAVEPESVGDESDLVGAEPQAQTDTVMPPRAQPEPVTADSTQRPELVWASADARTDSASSAVSMSIGQLDMSSWPTIAELPIELWLVIAAFAVPGAWLTLKIITLLPDAFKAFGTSFLGFRVGLALLLILLIVGLLGVAMLAIALRLYRRERVGRGLAFAFAGTLVISIAFSSGNTAAATWSMILSIIGILILALAPRVRQVFDQAAAVDGPPTSVVVSRTLIAIFSAIAVMVALIYLLLATASAKYAVAGIIAGLLAVSATLLARRLDRGDRQARLMISIGAGAYVILLLILGRAQAGLLVPIGLAVATVGFLWIPNDARAFFGDEPLSFPTA
jgi:hypothetical protein